MNPIVKSVKNKNLEIAAILILACIVRLFVFGLGSGYETDIICFKAWSAMLFDNGLSEFYLSDAFTDYPPGYMYVLLIIGAIRDALHLPFDSAAFTALVKLPACFSDILSVYFIYRLAERRTRYPAVPALFYALNPAIIINSSYWGQVDAVYTMILIFSVYLLTEKKQLAAYLLFVAAVLIKPQSLLFTPLYLYAAFSALSEGGFSAQAFKSLAAKAGICAGTFLLATLPFGIGAVIGQYINTIGSYPYAVLNAYNFYALVGANWTDVSDKLFFFSYGTWGIIFINLIVVISFILLRRKNSASDYFFVGAVLNTLTFMFSTRMHERYLFPTIAFLVIAFVYSGRQAYLWLAAGFSATLYINCTEVLQMITNGNNLVFLDDTLAMVSLANVGLTAYMLYLGFSVSKAADLSITPVKKVVSQQQKPSPVFEQEELPFATRFDFCAMAVIMLLYGVIAFYNLGDRAAPESTWKPMTGAEVIADFGSSIHVDEIRFFNSSTEERMFNLSYSEDGIFWQDFGMQNSDSVFAWHRIPLDFTARQIKITSLQERLALVELGFYSGSAQIPVRLMTTDGAELFDEQSMIPDNFSYRNSTYFDEIYHARTGYEFIHHLPTYEWTHPPLGKVIISIGIQLFGMNPFGWRFSGTLFGVLMIPLMYMFMKKLCKTSFWAVLGTLIFTFDFMHFAQTRISTIDTYVTFFIIAMYYFMYVYCNTDFYKGYRVFIPLGLSGLCMGLAIASKWPGIYAGAGLAMLFFINLYDRWTESKQNPINGELFPPRATTVVASCFVFFIAVPVVVYGLSYIPYLQAPDMDGIASIFENQAAIFGYHANLVSEHPYSSPWWQWPLDVRPIFYYIGELGNGMREGISSFGNPLVWWSGFVMLIFALNYISNYENHHTRNLVFLCIGLAAQFIPWILVSRTTYIYHYFPSVPFLALITAYYFSIFKRRIEAIVLCGAVIALFLMFYPVLSGMPVAPDYVRKYLEWLPSWQLI